MDRTTASTLLKDVLSHIFRSSVFIDACAPISDHFTIASGFEDVIDMRAQGDDRSPVVVFSFDSLQSIQSALDEGDRFILEPERGVFYLRLPTAPEYIRQVVNKADAMQGTVPLEREIYMESYRRRHINLFATNFIVFKHEFDNVFKSMQAVVGQARQKLERNPGSIPIALMGLKKEPIEHLAEKFRKLSSFSAFNRYGSVEHFDGMLRESANYIDKIGMCKTNPFNALRIAEICVTKLGNVNEFLSEVRALI